MKIKIIWAGCLLCLFGMAEFGVASTVVCFGDSITAGYKATGYPTYLQSMIDSSMNVVNAGLGGEDTAHGMSRLTEVIAANKPQYVVIMEGANDIVEGLSPSTTSYDLTNMAQQVRDAGGVPIMSTITPNTSNSSYVPENYNPLIIQAAASGGFTLVDTYNRVVNDWSNINVDGLHPNDAGSKMIAEGFAEALANVQSSQTSSQQTTTTTTPSSSQDAASTSPATTSSGSSSGGSSGCFIATAAYGSALEPQVVLLRKFRDLRLLTNAPGQAFVRWYYATSPPVAAFIARHDLARLTVRVALLPLLAAAWLLVEASALQQAALLLAASFLLAAIWKRRQEKRTARFGPVS